MGQVSFPEVSNYANTTTAEALRVFAVGGVSGGGSSAAATTGALLLEDGFSMLTEDGYLILLEQAYPVPLGVLLLENDIDFILLEDGSSYLLMG